MLMKAQAELKILEVDLSDSNVVAGVDKRLQYDLVRFLGEQGVRFRSGPKSSYLNGDMGTYMKEQLSRGKNYLLVDGFPAVDSQLTGNGRNVSMSFNLYQTRKEPGTIYLEATQVGAPRTYKAEKRIKSAAVDSIVKESGAVYRNLSERFVHITELKGSNSVQQVKPAVAKEIVKSGPEPKAVQTKSAEIAAPKAAENTVVFKKMGAQNPPTNQKWEDVIGKIDITKFPRAAKILSRELDMVKMENFQLDKLEQTFFFPGFQRRTPREQAIKIFKAMIANEFEGAVVKTMRAKNGMYEVDDGKTTLLDLKAVRDHIGVKTYNIYNLVYKDRKGNELFLRLNDGKNPGPYDKVRGLDDGETPFFNVLRPHLSYYSLKVAPLMTFTDMGYAHMYFETGNWHPNTKQLLAMIPQIPEQEVEKMEPFIKTFNESGPGFWIRKAVFRNLYKVFRDKKMNQSNFRKTMGIVTKDKRKLFSLSSTNSKDEFDEAYRVIGRYADRSMA